MRMLTISTARSVQELPRPQELVLLEQGSPATLVTGINSILCCPRPLSQRLAGKRQQEHLAFGKTQPVLMLQRRQTDSNAGHVMRFSFR